MRLPAAIGLGFGLFGAIAAANASGCPGNPGAMGTSRVLKIDPREYPLIGTVQYQETLPLNDKEVVLTFDDGPMPPYTNRVLEALAHECIKAPAHPSPPTRAKPVPILEVVRSVPLNADPAPEPQPDPQQVTRPLTPGFKPSHSDSPAMKVTEMPVERQQADPWAMRAELKPR